MGGGVEVFFLFFTHIGILHKNLSILSVDTWGKKHFLFPLAGVPVGVNVSESDGADVDEDVGDDVGDDVREVVGNAVGLAVRVDAGVDVGVDVGVDLGVDVGDTTWSPAPRSSDE